MHEIGLVVTHGQQGPRFCRLKVGDLLSHGNTFGQKKLLQLESYLPASEGCGMRGNDGVGWLLLSTFFSVLGERSVLAGAHSSEAETWGGIALWEVLTL
jgi:hypothetical protein